MALSNSYTKLLSLRFLIFHLGISFILSLPSESMLCHSDERTHLFEFMRSFNSSWMPGVGDNIDCCSWYGVECDEVTGHIVAFTSYDLDGFISPNSSLFRLTHLLRLDLFGNNFRYSEIPKSIMNLSSLEYLRIASSNLSGIIPSFLGNLTHLYTLDLSDNELIGQPFSSLSWLSHMPSLTQLDLSKSNLRGEIPMFIMNMTKLEFLRISYNNLNGPLDFNGFGNLKNLQTLDLSYINLSLLTEVSDSLSLPSLRTLTLESCELGRFPGFLRNLGSLTDLNLPSNKISGEIPEWFMSISTQSLELLSLSNNSLTGFEGKYKHLPLPWSNLYVFNIGYNSFQGSLPIPPAQIGYYIVNKNKFSGYIPSFFSKLKLRLLDISSNNFSGEIPRNLANLTSKIDVLNLRNNNFVGRIPEFLENDCYIRAIDLSFNQFNGSIPNSLAYCNRISFVSFKRNNLTGSLPSWFGSLLNLKVIDLSDNQLQGELPKSLVNCNNLEILSLGNNQIQDSFPSWIGHLPRLKVLSLCSNKLYGVVNFNNAEFKLHQIQILDISSNNFEGKLPFKLFKNLDAMKNVTTSKEAFIDTTWSSFYNADITAEANNKGNFLYYEKIPNALVILDFSSNKFGGSIPQVLGDLKGLRVLNLSSNILTGEIPSSLGNLSILESLDLSRNTISGKIPQELTNLDKLGFLDLSYNQLTGPIPKGRHFDTLVNSSITGNVGLCGEPSLNICNDESSEYSEDELESSDGIPWNIIMMGFGTGTIIGLSIGYMLIVWKHKLFVKIVGKIFHFRR